MTNGHYIFNLNYFIMKTKNEQLMKKPTPLRVLFLMNLFLVIICYVFYAFAQSKGNVAGVPANSILYTALSYTALFVGVIASIKKFNLLALRIVILLILAVSLPTLALIGIAISIISFILTFHSKVKAYLHQ